MISGQAGSSDSMAVVGGVYRETCMRPGWNEFYGSAGRAASALSSMGVPVTLHSYLDNDARAAIEARAIHQNYRIIPTQVERTVTFAYLHGLDTPRICGDGVIHNSLEVAADRAVRFGMIESDAVVRGGQVVYDPQNTKGPAPFAQNGSSADRLALILNRREAELLSMKFGDTPESMAEALIKSQGAEVVVIKLGALGALVHDGRIATPVAAYNSGTVWKLGSGDHFTAHFALRWIHEGRAAVESAELASLATAYYCQSGGVATAELLAAYSPAKVVPSTAFLSGRQPLVYLAGPFFSLAQLWIIEQARYSLVCMGLRVFSPYHEIGIDSAEKVVPADLAAIHDADLIFAIGDGMDPGTIYEIGYGRAKGKPVVLYCENESEERKKMMQGSGCVLCDDYVSAIYQALWTACAL